MAAKDTLLQIEYVSSGEKYELSLTDLINRVSGFLDILCVKTLVGEEFYRIIMDGDGHSRFLSLLNACGYSNDPKGFFGEVLDQLGRADGSAAIAVNSVELPKFLLMEVLELALPGNRFISIKTVEQLEQATNVPIPLEDRGGMQKVLDTYPVRLSMHTIRQMRVSRDVAYQYMPFVEELDPIGHTNTWIGQFHQGLLEQMYQNRVIFLLNMSCPVYCRFCFRKHKESRNEANPEIADVEKAVQHVKNSPAIKEIVVTGGDPFMNSSNMACTIDSMMEVEHVQSLRLATRSIAYYPHMFLADDAKLLNYLKRKNLELQENGKRLEVATHFIHPDEISTQSLQIITELVSSGVAVYVQTPFLSGCNDQGPELVRLFSLLRGAGAELHYIYIPCSPIHGNSIYWAPISKGIEVGNYLRAHLSDRVIPRICTATPIGKMDWFSSGWAVEPVEDNPNFIWIRSPYTPDYFKEFAPIANELENIRVNEEGTIDIQYMADIGDESLFLGARPFRLGGGMTEPESTDTIIARVVTDDTLSPSVVPTGVSGISRVHKTRVEMACDADHEAIDYIKENESITDVVIFSKTDLTQSLSKVKAIVRQIEDIPHVNSVRLRSLFFNYEPDRYSPAAIDIIASLNRLTIVNPLRVEIETQFLTAEEITDKHEKLAAILRNKGITVYNNTPLLGRINDNPEEMHSIAYRCREAGIEFHHLYVAGTPIQEEWNRHNPVALYDIVDIATRIRREGSGREIPRHVIRTVLGEVDFGLSSSFIGEAENLWVKLQPYDLGYFRELYRDFQWPKDVREDSDGRPIVPVAGLLKTTDFPLS